MKYRALLLDVGGPLEDERAQEAEKDRQILAAFQAEGKDVASRLAGANRRAVNSFAQNLYDAVIFDLANRDPALTQRVTERFRRVAQGRPPFVLRPGMLALVRDCHRAGLRIGLCANQVAAAREVLAQSPLAPYLSYGEVSDTLGLRKPDPRLFLTVLEGLGATPGEAIMIGDRIDNDIAPARRLGITAIRLRIGRHRHQKPRSLIEIPDADVTTVAGLRQSLCALGIDL
ncbi:HAD family hydrolase [Lacibacterium aquatile]|uniref:HAD family hydrolase n=1 Tax=Lacibacterium aquatile TaxID=1168082 RepID=A0ABW5DKW9_9PROT